MKLTQIAGLPEAETTIAVNPTNPLNIVAGALSVGHGCYFYASQDGGQTWTQGALEIPLAGYVACYDPVLTFCNDGSAYYAAGGYGDADNGQTKSTVFVFRSTDGGLTWPSVWYNAETITPFTQLTDKPWITCDRSGSSYDGTLYLEYTNSQRTSCSDPSCRAIKIRRSTDHGATWAAEVIASDNPQAPQNQGSLAVGPNGELYVAWDWVTVAGDNFGVVKFDKSTNRGVTFGTDKVASAFTGIDPDPNFRRSTYPVIGVDGSNGPHRGTIYIAFADARFGDPDILLVRSADGGTSWSAPVRVNDDPIHNLADQWAPGMAVDPLGRVVVTFSDRRRFVGTERYEIWGAISRDGGVTFDSNFLIGDTPSDVLAIPGEFLGDYDSVAVTSAYIYPTWADQRVPQTGETPDIYSDRYPNMFAYDEVKNVIWSDATSMSFDAQDARFGVDLDYDVAGGLLSELRADQAYTRVGCVAPQWPAPPLVDARVPPESDGYYYLVRVHKGSGVGTYGDGWPPARPNVRDPLDETLVTCP